MWHTILFSSQNFKMFSVRKLKKISHNLIILPIVKEVKDSDNGGENKLPCLVITKRSMEVNHNSQVGKSKSQAKIKDHFKSGNSKIRMNHHVIETHGYKNIILIQNA